MKNKFLNSMLVFAAVLLQVARLEAAQYDVIDLGPGSAYGINTYGQVVGGSTYPFVWTPSSTNGTTGTKTDLTDPNLTSPYLYGGGAAASINDSGIVAGYYTGDLYWPDYDFHECVSYYAFRWDPASANATNGTFSNLSVPQGIWYGASCQSWASSINSQGQIAGGFCHASHYGYSFIHQSNQFMEISTVSLPQDLTWVNCSSANGINNNGVMVGRFTEAVPGDPDGGWTGNRYQHAYIHETNVMTDLGNLLGGYVYGEFSQANAINTNKMVVGSSTSTNLSGGSACVWTNGTAGSLIDIHGISGCSFSESLAVNNSGTVVGYVYLNQGGYAAFVYTSSSGMTNLNSLISSGSGWQLKSAQGINDLGQIVGYGTLSGYSGNRAFLLNPTQ